MLPKKPLLFWLAPLLVLGILVIATPRLLPRVAGPPHAFYWKDGAWHEVPGIPGTLLELRISLAGAIWVSTSSPAGLSRYESGKWVFYNSSDFGTSSGWVRGGFAFSGEQVWAATADGVVHFDGQKWRLDATALKTEEPAATVANEKGSGCSTGRAICPISMARVGTSRT